MTQKITFKPQGAEGRLPGQNRITRTWDIKCDGVVVGTIESSIRDLNGDYSNPGYSVVVTSEIYGVVSKYYRTSNVFSNRSAREARENRSIYVSEAKVWATRTCRAQDKQHKDSDEQKKPV